MRLLRSSLLSFCVVAIFFSQFRAHSAKPEASPDRLFDEYGRINWEDEQAHLDNFAIQLMSDPDTIGYIFVINGRDGCPGEAAARAIRAKRYVVEQRGVPWNRVIWKEDGFDDTLRTVLQPAPREWRFSYPSFGSKASPGEIRLVRNCRATIAQIKRSN